MPVPPPVVMLMMASLRSLMPRAYWANNAGSAEGLPSSGFRACTWSTAAPACAAATPWSMRSLTVYGRYGDIDGVCPEPVSAQVMMTLAAMAGLLRSRYERFVTNVQRSGRSGKNQYALFPRSPPGALDPPPSLVAPSSLLSPGGGAPFGSRGPGRLPSSFLSPGGGALWLGGGARRARLQPAYGPDRHTWWTAQMVPGEGRHGSVSKDRALR